MLFLLVLVFGSCSVKNVTANKVNKDNNALGQNSIKFVYFYRGFAAVKLNMINTFPQGTFAIETDEDWHDFMDKYVPGIHYDVSVDYSKECLVYAGTLPAQDIYSEGVDIRGLSMNNNKLEVQYIGYPNTGVGNGIYAQDAEGYINCFVNIVKVNKKDMPGKIENVYHKK